MENGLFSLNPGLPVRRGILVAGSRIFKAFSVKAFNNGDNTYMLSISS